MNWSTGQKRKMYKKIEILPPEVADKIAAGEVIERPAQAVKELVENSIDAESSEISIEIEKGGKILIKVVDNGIGMRPEDMIVAFKRHATSKISTVSDLEHIATLGFRGEALASLASCSRIEAVSKVEEYPVAKIVRIEGGRIKYTGEVARTRGTTILVQDLFFNLPPRRKFLRSVSTEAGHIIDILSQMALAYLNIHFKLIMDGDVVFDLPAGLSFERRVGELYGRELEKEIIPLRGEKEGMKLSGGILPPVVVRPNKQLQIFIVNRRPVRSPLLSHALNTAFQSLIPSGKFPIGFILLDIPPEQVDVNIHPTKREIKFVKDRDVHSFIVAAIRLSMQNIEREIQEPPPENKIEKTSTTYTVPSHGIREDVESYLDEVMGPVGLIGQVKDTYLIIEKASGIEIIDQHAAHERILYEGIKRQIEKGGVERQQLLFPISIELSLRESRFLRDKIDWFSELGIEMEGFGKNIFNVRTIPSQVKDENVEEFISGLINELVEVGRQKSISDLRDEALKIIACRASIMAGNKLSEKEKARLITELGHCQNNMTCPHGRPIKIILPWEDIEKKFKR